MSYFAVSKEQYDLYDGDKKFARGQYLVHLSAKKYGSAATRTLRDAAAGYTKSMTDNELKYFNDQNGTTFLCVNDAKSYFFRALGYSGTLTDMYYASLLNSISGVSTDYSLTDAERAFYSDTTRVFS